MKFRRIPNKNPPERKNSCPLTWHMEELGEFLNNDPEINYRKVKDHFNDKYGFNLSYKNTRVFVLKYFKLENKNIKNKLYAKRWVNNVC